MEHNMRNYAITHMWQSQTGIKEYYSIMDRITSLHDHIQSPAPLNFLWGWGSTWRSVHICTNNWKMLTPDIGPEGTRKSAHISEDIIAMKFEPLSTSHPPNVIHVIGVPRPFPCFALFRFCVLYWSKTEKQKTGEAWERGYRTSML